MDIDEGNDMKKMEIIAEFVNHIEILGLKSGSIGKLVDIAIGKLVREGWHVRYGSEGPEWIKD